MIRTSIIPKAKCTTNMRAITSFSCNLLISELVFLTWALRAGGWENLLDLSASSDVH
jgi:hypothetical protein